MFVSKKYTEKKTNDVLLSPKDNIDAIWKFDFPKWAGTWSDFCAGCERGGHLILCEGPCVGGYCLECLKLDEDPKDDPWYCPKCKALREKREEIYQLTGGKSSRFRPNTYKIKIWMDRNDANEDPYDVYQTENILTAKCFYPDKKSKNLNHQNYQSLNLKKNQNLNQKEKVKKTNPISNGI